MNESSSRLIYIWGVVFLVWKNRDQAPLSSIAARLREQASQTPLRYVANLLRKNHRSPTGWFFNTKIRLFFGGMLRTSSPTRNFIIFRRGELCSPVFTNDNRLFSGAPRDSPTGWFFNTKIRLFLAGCRERHPLQGILLFSVGANCVRPPL